MFEFYGYTIQVLVDEGGATFKLIIDEDESIEFHTRSRDPLAMAALLRSDLDLQFHSELEELAGLIDAHI
jgi:hypothetical protein